ncbi:MAG: cyclic nucleotide-binding protein, partial [Proteobacteria bacterium]|nr:cyclic nucleotide-binding protein [Pseudomonadota bacterium]
PPHMAEHFEVAIIGAGPAGLGAATNAASHKLSHILIEKSEIGNTIFDYQLGKLVMAEPGKLPLRAKIGFEQGTREEILEVWNRGVKEAGVNFRKAEVKKIAKTDSPSGAAFEIACVDGVITAKHVILAIGVQGTPRKLGVPGEDLPHIAYTLKDPGAFKDRDIVIVGAGDAAIENALGLMERNRVSLINRGAEFPRAKEANIQKISDAAKQGKLKVYFSTTVSRVDKECMAIATPQGDVQLKADHIIARLGGILPRKFLEDSGIKFPSPDPAAVPVVSSRYESNVPGLFVLGALIGYPLIKQAMNQGYEVIEHILGNPIEPADQVLVQEKLAGLPGDINQNLKMIWSKLPLFKELSESQFRELIIDSTVHQKDVGQVVFERNDYTDTFWSVVSGSVEIEVPGKPSIVISEGNFFGELGLLSGRRRTATVRVREKGILLESPRKQLLKLNNAVASVKQALDSTFITRALQTSVFPDASGQFLSQIAAKAKMFRAKKGEVLFREGDPGDKLFVIRKGSVKVSRKGPKGTEVAQTYIAAGNMVGEMSLLSEETRPRSATVTAAVPVEAIILEKTDFLALLAGNPETKKRVHQLAREREVQNLTENQNEYVGRMLDFAMAEGITDADNFLLIDSDLCVGCDNCEKACAATHQGFSRLDRKGGKTLASLQIPVSCRHCENPLCMLDCPPDALTR